MNYLLDTNICIYLLNRNPGYEQIIAHIDGRAYREIGISAITLAELEYGSNYSAQKNHKKSLTGFLRIFPAFSAIQGLASNPCLRSIIIL